MNPELISYAKQFNLSAIVTGRFVPTESFEPVLLELLRTEAKCREERATTERIRKAKLPTFKSFEEFDTDFQKGISATELEILANLQWLEGLFNLILIGPPGTGKTHLALAIGHKAVREGYKTAFVSMDNLVHILATREVSRKSQTRMSWFRKCDLLIVDEFGYLPVTRQEANYFFAFVSELYEKSSIIITSNKGFDGWAEILGDQVLTTALLDRLTHRCQILNLTGKGWRVAHRKQIFAR